MGLLDQLWDETVAGPPPDSGLGKLRKCFFSPSSSAAAVAVDQPAGAVTHSITIVRPPSLSVRSTHGESSLSSVPSSPACAPNSPFATATTPKGNSWRRLRRKSKTAVDAASEPAVGPRSPTVYDWVVISSLDR